MLSSGHVNPHPPDPRAPILKAPEHEIGDILIKLDHLRKTELEAAALDYVDEVANRPDVRLEFLIQPGEAFFQNNYVVLHGRTEFEDDEDEVEEELRARESAAASGNDKDASERTQQVSEKTIPPPAEENIAQPTNQKQAAKSEEEKKVVEEPHRDTSKASAESVSKPQGDEGGELVPRASHDAKAN